MRGHLVGYSIKYIKDFRAGGNRTVNHSIRIGYLSIILR